MREQYKKLFDSIREYIKALDKENMKEVQGEGGAKEESPDEKLAKDFLNDFQTKGVETNESSQVLPPATTEFKYLLRVLDDTSFDEGVIPYSEITRIIFQSSQIELLDMLEDYFEENWSYYITRHDVNSDLKKKFLKLKEHIGLSTLQRSHIGERLDDKFESFEEKHSQVTRELDGYKKQIDDFNESISLIEEEVRGRYERLITQFISILGIFAAILMGAFGSIQSFTSIFNNADDIPIGKILVVSSIGGSAVVLILFFLFNGISKLTGFKLSSCNCHLKKRRKSVFERLSETVKTTLLGSKEEEEDICSCSIMEKHPSVVLIHYLLYFISITGFILIYVNENSNFSSLYHSPLDIWLTVLVTYGGTSLFLILLHVGFISKKRNEKWYLQFVPKRAHSSE